MSAARRTLALDLVPAAFVTSVTAVLAVRRSAFFGEPLQGPLVLRVLMPFLLGAPLAFRRRRPLLTWCLGMGGVALQSFGSGTSPEGLEILVVLFVGSYAVAAYSPRPRALVGLVVLVVGYVPYALYVPGIGHTGPGDEWATAFFAAATLGCWLVGFVVHGRRDERTLVRRTAELEEAAATVLRDERGRIARELHDIVSHRLSVVVVQAAGARAQASDDDGTLEKIENQAREALVEMRQMLDLLREDEAGPDVAPQPGLADLPQLVTSVREAGLEVELTMAADARAVPRAVGLSAYRIVQESLTNALRHSGARSGRVEVLAADGQLHITVEDDGGGMPVDTPLGHGLAGMRERTVLLGGALEVTTSPTGVRVQAVLPMAAAT